MAEAGAAFAALDRIGVTRRARLLHRPARRARLRQGAGAGARPPVRRRRHAGGPGGRRDGRAGRRRSIDAGGAGVYLQVFDDGRPLSAAATSLDVEAAERGWPSFRGGRRPDRPRRGAPALARPASLARCSTSPAPDSGGRRPPGRAARPLGPPRPLYLRAPDASPWPSGRREPVAADRAGGAPAAGARLHAAAFDARLVRRRPRATLLARPAPFALRRRSRAAGGLHPLPRRGRRGGGADPGRRARAPPARRRAGPGRRGAGRAPRPGAEAMFLEVAADNAAALALYAARASRRSAGGAAITRRPAQARVDALILRRDA